MHPGKYLAKAARDSASKLAVIEDERTITYGQLFENAAALSVRLRQLGCGKGRAVVLFLPNCIEFATSYFAVMLLGGVAALTDARLKAPELAAFVDVTKPEVVITTPDLEPLVKNAIGRLPFEVSVQSTASFAELSQAGAPSADELPIEKVAPDAAALYLSTSGTTREPHTVVLTYSQLDLFPETMHAMTQTSAADVVGIILPMSHISGPIICNEIVKYGIPLVLLPIAHPEKTLSLIEKHGVTWFHGVPAVFQVLLRLAKVKQCELKSLRFVALMGTVVPVPLLRESAKQFPHTAIIQGYGTTETSPLVTLLRTEEAQRKIGSVGQAARRCEIMIVGNDGNELLTGHIGEVIVKGPQVMKGYLNDPEATARVIKDGWYHSRDAGYFDEDGYLYILGRKDDVIITGGLNVHPGQVENVLSEHPCVLEAAVVPAPHKLSGVVLHAVVVLKSNCRATESDLIAFCRERLAEFKTPRQIEFRENLPRTRMGKIDRQALGAQA
ncbi:acyl--CoA ligase [bacterium]|nr:acyl--CoA ligase [bacterium]